MAIYNLIGLTVLTHSAHIGSRIAVTLYAIELEASPFTIGTLLALYGLLPMLFAVGVGRLIDRVSARWPLLAGSVLLAAGVALPFLAPGVAFLYPASALIGLGSMIYQITVQNIVGFIGKPEDRPTNFSLLGLGYSTAMLLGPLVAGFTIDGVGHRNAFLALFLLPIAPIAALAFSGLGLPRPQTLGVREGERRVMDLLTHRELRRVLIINALLSVSWDLHGFMMPIYGARIELSASMIGMVMASFAAATFAVRMAMPFLSRRVTAWRLLGSALIIAAIAFVLIPLVTGIAPLFALSFLLGLGLGSGQPMVLALMHDAAPEGRSGEAVGLRFAFIYGSQTLMPVVYGALGSVLGITAVFWLVAVALAGGSRIATRPPPP